MGLEGKALVKALSNRSRRPLAGQERSPDDARHRRKGRCVKGAGVTGVRKAPGPSAETRARVFAAADELGYRVNRTAALMSARRSHLIGVTAEIRNGFHAEMVENIVEAADLAGYEVVLGAVTPTIENRRSSKHCSIFAVKE